MKLLRAQMKEKDLNVCTTLCISLIFCNSNLINTEKKNFILYKKNVS